jgi:hypothetical protein
MASNRGVVYVGPGKVEVQSKRLTLCLAENAVKQQLQTG